MGRTGGEKTKRKILATAEKLFAEKGYDGTGIQDIASVADVNKALIYYHFKNKRDVLESLFQQTIDEMFVMQGSADKTSNDAMDDEEKTKNNILEIIALLEKKKKILAVMLAESLKLESDGYRSLFQCAKMVIEKDVNESIHTRADAGKKRKNKNELLMHEFYTGFLPVVFFALFKDRWADFFGCSREESIRLFSTIFIKSHICHPEG